MEMSNHCTNEMLSEKSQMNQTGREQVTLLLESRISNQTSNSPPKTALKKECRPCGILAENQR